MCIFWKNFIGLDIADNSIEVALVKNTFGKAKVLSLGRVELEEGTVERGRIKDSTKLALAVKKVMAEAKPKVINSREVYFGLPESQTFVHHFYLPAENKKERQSFIDKELSENIPIEFSNLVYSYRILGETKEKLEVLIVASRKNVITEWFNFFKSLKLEVVNFDIEILATFRSLFVNLPKEPVMLLDIGSTTTFVGIFDEFGLHYEYIINLAGNDFTKAVAKGSGGKLDFVKAETEKIKLGLKSRNKKVVEALEFEFEKILEEIKQSIIDYKTETGKEVAEMVLVGGSSSLIGLPEYFSKVLNLPVKVGKAKLVDEEIPLFYIEAIGLALRGIENHWDGTDPNIPKI